MHCGSAAWALPIIVSTSNKAASLTADPVQRFVIVAGFIAPGGAREQLGSADSVSYLEAP
jgi:hypothetical protein